MIGVLQPHHERAFGHARRVCYEAEARCQYIWRRLIARHDSMALAANLFGIVEAQLRIANFGCTGISGNRELSQCDNRV